MRTRGVILVLAALLGVAALPALQDEVSGQQPARRTEPDFRLRVKVELVTTPVTVFDAQGDFVYGLTRDDFTVWDNEVQQQITQFELSSPPISLVLLLNTSSRIKPLLDRVRSTGILFQSYILGESGEAAVITFDDEVQLRQDFTAEAEKVEKAIKAIKPGGDKTRLADALDRAIRMLTTRPPDRRRVIVIISEPRDISSETPLGEPLRTAQLADISIYTLALSYTEALWKTKPEDRPVPSSPFPPGVFPTPPRPGTTQTPGTEQHYAARGDLLALIRQLVAGLRAPVNNVLEVLAQGTGGRAHETSDDRTLQEAVRRIGDELHNQYLLAYRPSNLDQEGFHEIRVRVRRDAVHVHARPGYYLGPPQ